MDKEDKAGRTRHITVLVCIASTFEMDKRSGKQRICRRAENTAGEPVVKR
jgi:hypothetical protein